jgi:hypothetical protein
VFKPLKSFAVLQTLDAGASIVTVSLACSQGAAAKAYPETNIDTPTNIALLTFMISSPY